MQIGEKMKLLRLSKNMTIKRLAQKTGLSVGFISNVERDINSPTISSLQKICRALDTDIADFFTTINNSSMVLRKEERQLMQSCMDSHFKVEMFALPRHKLQPYFIEVLPGGHYGDETMCHENEEMCLVVEGQVLFGSGAEVHELSEGDCIYVESLVPHWMRNVSDSIVRTCWATINNGV
jgi:transcriptional regulator with XRE-family HTH domain